MAPGPDGDDRRRRWLLLGLVVLLVALAGCGEARPVPNVCHGCAEGGATQALPADAEVGESTTHLYLDGEPRVVARTRLDAGTADELRRNASRRRAVLATVRAARNGGTAAGEYGPATPTRVRYGTGDGGLPSFPVPAFESRNLSVGVADDDLVVEFRVAGVPGGANGSAAPLARPGYGGSVLVDRFHTFDGRNEHPRNVDSLPYRVETDRIVVHAPSGTRPVITPPNATVRGDRVLMESLPGDTYLVFAGPGTSGGMLARATLAADVLGWAVPDAAGVALLPTLQLGVVLAGLRRADRGGGTRYAAGAALVALLLVLAPVALLLGPIGLGAVLVVLVVAGLLFRRSAGGDDADGDSEDDDPTGATGDGEPDTDRGPDSDPGSPGAVGRDDRQVTGGAEPGSPSPADRVRPWLRPVVATLGGLAVLTVAAAAYPWTAGLGGLLFLVGALLPVVALGAMGWISVGVDAATRRRWLVSGVFAGPWLFGVGHVLTRDRPEFITAVLLVVVWGVVVTVLGVVANRLAARVARSRGEGAASSDTV